MDSHMQIKIKWLEVIVFVFGVTSVNRSTERKCENKLTTGNVIQTYANENLKKTKNLKQTKNKKKKTKKQKQTKNKQEFKFYSSSASMPYQSGSQHDQE